MGNPHDQTIRFAFFYLTDAQFQVDDGEISLFESHHQYITLNATKSNYDYCTA